MVSTMCASYSETFCTRSTGGGKKVSTMTTVILEKNKPSIEKLPNYDTENERLDLFICFFSFYCL